MQEIFNPELMMAKLMDNPALKEAISKHEESLSQEERSCL